MRPVVIAGATGTGKSVPLFASRNTLARDHQLRLRPDLPRIRRRQRETVRRERLQVPHHLYTSSTPEDEFTAADYARAARPLLDRIAIPILVGGTFFYLRALLSGLPDMPSRDPVLRSRIRRIAEKPRGPQHLHRWLSRVDPLSASRIPPPDRHRVERALEVWSIAGRPISSFDRDTGKELPATKDCSIDRP